METNAHEGEPEGAGLGTGFTGSTGLGRRRTDRGPRRVTLGGRAGRFWPFLAGFGRWFWVCAPSWLIVDGRIPQEWGVKKFFSLPFLYRLGGIFFGLKRLDVGKARWDSGLGGLEGFLGR